VAIFQTLNDLEMRNFTRLSLPTTFVSFPAAPPCTPFPQLVYGELGGTAVPSLTSVPALSSKVHSTVASPHGPGLRAGLSSFGRNGRCRPTSDFLPSRISRFLLSFQEVLPSPTWVLDPFLISAFPPPIDEPIDPMRFFLRHDLMASSPLPAGFFPFLLS